MGVRSFLVYTAPGAKDTVARVLQAEPFCEVYPAENRDVVVAVSDLPDQAAEEAFDERLTSIPGVVHVALVAGYESSEA
jgi:nitrate reductase NapAB chaperone NapD